MESKEYKEIFIKTIKSIIDHAVEALDNGLDEKVT